MKKLWKIPPSWLVGAWKIYDMYCFHLLMLVEDLSRHVFGKPWSGHGMNKPYRHYLKIPLMVGIIVYRSSNPRSKLVPMYNIHMETLHLFTLPLVFLYYWSKGNYNCKMHWFYYALTCNITNQEINFFEDCWVIPYQYGSFYIWKVLTWL